MLGVGDRVGLVFRFFVFRLEFFYYFIRFFEGGLFFLKVIFINGVDFSLLLFGIFFFYLKILKFLNGLEKLMDLF